jgi:hypothetical protein
MKNDFDMHGKDLDGELSSPAQQRVREIVHSLPEETLSLSWRSDLNARLRSEAARRRKLNLFGWVWKPAVGVAFAAVLVLAFVARMPNMGPVERPRPNVEQALIGSYVDTTASLDIAGDVSPMGEKDQPQKPVQGDWEQEDVGATL